MINKVFNAMAYGFKAVQEFSKEVTSPAFLNAMATLIAKGTGIIPMNEPAMSKATTKVHRSNRSQAPYLKNN